MHCTEESQRWDDMSEGILSSLTKIDSLGNDRCCNGVWRNRLIARHYCDFNITKQNPGSLFPSDGRPCYSNLIE
jgi:hypothetical protein